MPSTTDLFDLLSAWVPDEKTRKLILVDNPAALLFIWPRKTVQAQHARGTARGFAVHATEFNASQHERGEA